MERKFQVSKAGGEILPQLMPKVYNQYSNATYSVRTHLYRFLTIIIADFTARVRQNSATFQGWLASYTQLPH